MYLPTDLDAYRNDIYLRPALGQKRRKRGSDGGRPGEAKSAAGNGGTIGEAEMRRFWASISLRGIGDEAKADKTGAKGRFATTTVGRAAV